MAALAHGKPCIIDTDYCDVQMIDVEDLSHMGKFNANIFVHWVRMWEIAGRINKELYFQKQKAATNLSEDRKSSRISPVTRNRSRQWKSRSKKRYYSIEESDGGIKRGTTRRCGNLNGCC